MIHDQKQYISSECVHTLAVCRHVYRCVVDLCDIFANPDGSFVVDTCRCRSYSTLWRCHLDRIAKSHQHHTPYALLQYHHTFYIDPYPICEQRPSYTFLWLKQRECFIHHSRILFKPPDIDGTYLHTNNGEIMIKRANPEDASWAGYVIIRFYIVRR